MEEIDKSGGRSAACHAQMYTVGALLRHGSDRLKNTCLPLIAKGEVKRQIGRRPPRRNRPIPPSGRQDLNLRPLDPQVQVHPCRAALPGHIRL